MPRFLLVLLIALTLLSPGASSARELVATLPGWDPGATWFFIDTTGAVGDFSQPVDVCPTTSITADVGTAAFSVYATIPADDTLAEIEARTQIAGIGADQPSAFILNGASNQIRIVVDTKETTSPATWVRVFCNKSASGSNDATQPSPPAAVHFPTTRGSITNPSNTSYGYFTQFGSLTEFAAETYPGSGIPGNEANNQSCFSYNKDGCDGNLFDQFEYAMDDSYELSYRSTGGSNGDTWWEHNVDFSPPDQRSTVTGGAGFDPAVGSYITFSGGGTGVVLAWNLGTGVLDWRQHYGTTAEGQTVTGTGGSKTLGTIAWIGYLKPFRPHIATWNSSTNRASWEWLTISSDQTYGGNSTLKLQNGRVGINMTDQVSANLEAHGSAFGTAFPVAWFEYVGAASDPDQDAAAMWLEVDLASIRNTLQSVPYARGLVIRQPTPPPGATNVYQSFAIEIRDQRGIGNNRSSTINQYAQTCGGSACSEGKWGNYDLLGGDWNNGHISFGGEGNSANHLWSNQGSDRLMYSMNDAPDNATDGRALTELVFSGTRAMATSAIGAGACNTADANVTATGAVATDVVKFSPNADPGLNSGLLVYSAWAGTDVISFRVCNPSAGSITPAAMTLNWRIDR